MNQTDLALEVPTTTRLNPVRLSIEDPRWMEFIEACPQATIFHHPAWLDLIQKVYGYRPILFALEDERQRIVAGLPVSEVKNWYSGKKWVSLPFSDHTAPLAEVDEDATELLDQIRSAQMTEQVKEFELRYPVQMTGTSQKGGQVIHFLELGADPKQVHEGFSRTRVQQQIARAEREGLEVRQSTQREDVDTFYSIHLQTRRRLGVPVQPKRYFDRLHEQLISKGLGFVLLAYQGTVPVAGSVFLTFNRVITYKYGASLSNFLGLKPNHLILWSAIQWACQNGYRLFDWGKTESSNQGLRDFKAGWGAQEQDLAYTYSSLRPRPEKEGFSAQGRLYPTMEKLIQKSPLWVCRLTGELLYKYAA